MTGRKPLFSYTRDKGKLSNNKTEVMIGKNMFRDGIPRTYSAALNKLDYLSEDAKANGKSLTSNTKRLFIIFDMNKVFVESRIAGHAYDNEYYHLLVPQLTQDMYNFCELCVDNADWNHCLDIVNDTCLTFCIGYNTQSAAIQFINKPLQYGSIVGIDVKKAVDYKYKSQGSYSTV